MSKATSGVLFCAPHSIRRLHIAYSSRPDAAGQWN
jgi:hypothetical protein